MKPCIGKIQQHCQTGENAMLILISEIQEKPRFTQKEKKSKHNNAHTEIKCNP